MKSSTMSPRRFLIAFVAVQVVLAAFFLDTRLTPNPASRAFATASLVDRGTLAIDQLAGLTSDESRVGRHVYSDKAPLSSVLVAPFYAAAEHVPAVARSPALRLRVLVALGGLLAGTLPFVLLATACFVAIRDRPCAVPPVLLATLPLYGSFLFVYAGTYFGHLLAGAWLLAAYLALRRDRLGTAGLLLGLGFLTEYPVALALGVWAVQLAVIRRDVRAPARLVAGFVPAALALLAYNELVTGTPLVAYSFVSQAPFAAMRHHLGFGWPSAHAAWQLLFGTFRGACFYAPILLLFAFAWLRAPWPRAWLAHPLGPLAVAYVVLIASYYMWWGGWAYGPRHLIPIAMLVCYEGIVTLATGPCPRLACYGLSLLGLGGALLAKATVGYMVPDALDNPVPQFLIPLARLGRWNHDSLAGWLGAPDGAAWAIWLALAAAGLGGLCYLARRARVSPDPRASRDRSSS